MNKQEFEIINILHEKDYSIVELANKLNMKRSTLKYYLNNLQSKRIISFKRVEKKISGRPTIVSLNIKHFEDKRKETLNNPVVVKLFESLLEKGEVSESEFVARLREDGLALDFLILRDALVAGGYIEDFIKLTDFGKKYLKQHDKS